MWWIALYLPQWPLEALRASAAAPPLGQTAAQAVVEGGRIGWLDAHAAQAGVQAGMTVASAQACLPGLWLRARRPDQEVRALQMLALSMLRFSPHLSLQPEGLLLEVQSSLRLFGGPLRLWRQLQTVLKVFNVSAHLAAAPFPESAWLLAKVRGPQYGGRGASRIERSRIPPLTVAQSRQVQPVQQALDALPLPAVLQAWGCTTAATDLLLGLGTGTLGELRVLPRGGLQRRLGAELLGHLDRAYGLIPDPRSYWAAPAAFDERLELPERTSDTAMVEQALQRLLQALQGWLSAHGRLAQVLALHLQHEARRGEPLPDTVHHLRLSAPERDAGVLHRLWAERLTRQPLTAPVVALRLMLQLHQAPDAQQAQQALELPRGTVTGSTAPVFEAPGTTRQAMARLLDRLQARLGQEAVRGLRSQDDHRPERASLLVELVGEEAAAYLRASPTPLHMPSGGAPSQPRPLWLLPQPQPLTEHHGQPVHAGAALVLRTRAERIEAGWFDGEPVCRDYHVAEGPDQRLR